MNGYNADIQSEQIQKLSELFPEVVREGKVDFDALKATLGEDIELGEKYGLSWKGKSSVFAKIQEKTVSTLHPQPEESVDWDTTQNMSIEGDNLEALKVLHKAYYGKIKMIYIDPPYNTGNDFVYNDDFKKTRREQALEDGVIDDEGNVTRDDGLRVNTGGHKHSNWLDMMYPRLFLARNLLRQDGVIFVSIDDNEVHNLRLMMNEIFGEENFIAQFVWKKKGTSTNVAGTQTSALTEYIVAFARSGNTQLNPRIVSRDERLYPYKDADGQFRTTVIEKKSTGDYDRATMKFEIIGQKPRPGKRWQIGETKARELEAKHRFMLENGIVKLKIYSHEDTDTSSANPNLLLDHGSTQSGQAEVDKLMEGSFFDTPKPVSLMKHLLKLSTNQDSLVLDFFGGSGTTAHATEELNAEDGGRRQWITVQLPEITDEKSEAFKAGYKTIAEISRERIRRAGAKIKQMNDKEIVTDSFWRSREPNVTYPQEPAEEHYRNLDLGFRSYVLGDSNFKKWNELVAEPDEIKQQALDSLNPLEDGVTDDDLLTEILLKRGVSPLVEVETHDDFVFVPSENLAISLSRHMTEELFATILAKSPSQIILLDQAFRDDVNLKTNLILQAEKQDISVEVL